MMLQLTSVHEWQVLRILARSPKKRPVKGSDLRPVPSRRTQEGKHLPDFVKKGLIEVVEEADNPLNVTYKLTPLGEYAAEYGEYEVNIPGATADSPITGLMAELIKTRGRSKNGKAPVGEPEAAVA